MKNPLKSLEDVVNELSEEEQQALKKELEGQALEAFNEAKLHMLNKQNSAFLSSLLHNFKVEVDNEGTETIMHNLNEQTITINGDWFCELEPDMRATALGEQIYHIAFLHEWRKGKRDPELYQKACDEVVRHMLEKTGFTLFPEMKLDEKYSDQSVEYVYTEMEKTWKKDNNPANGKNQGSSSNSGNNNQSKSNDPLGNDINPSNDQPNSHAMTQMQQHLSSASMAEEMVSGKDPSKSGAEFEKVFEKLSDGKLSWNTILQNYLNEVTQGEISYERFDRRMLPYELYLPTNTSRANINKVALAFDVSGSVSEEQIQAFLREMKSIKSQLNPKILDVLVFNHRIVDIFTFTENDSLDNVKMKISGGTDLEPVFEHYLKPKNKPEFLIVFSDLECYAIEDKPPFDTIWICIDNPTAEVNFGKLIHIDTEELVNG